MATEAQTTANCANAQLSTGPRTAAGKQAVAKNGLSHGLSSTKFAVLPHENLVEYEALLASLQEEFEPGTPTEDFLVEEMARAQWKLRRATAIEHELLSGQADLTKWFKEDCSKDNALLKLNRYENTARRAWYKAFTEIRKQQSQLALDAERQEKAESSRAATALNRQLAGQIAESDAEALAIIRNAGDRWMQNRKANPMPEQLQAELGRLKARDPLFDPKNDRTQMSKQLQRWFEKQ